MIGVVVALKAIVFAAVEAGVALGLVGSHRSLIGSQLITRTG